MYKINGSFGFLVQWSTLVDKASVMLLSPPVYLSPLSPSLSVLRFFQTKKKDSFSIRSDCDMALPPQGLYTSHSTHQECSSSAFHPINIFILWPQLNACPVAHLPAKSDSCGLALDFR